MSIAYEICKYLESLNIGTEGIDFFVGFEPDSPVNCVTFYDEAVAGLSESSSLAVDRVGLQVLTRNSNYLSAEEKIKNIHRIIAGFGGSSLIGGGSSISYITVETSPYSLGKDKDGNNQWTAHYNVRYETENDENRL